MGKIITIKVVKNIDGLPPSSEWSNSYHIETTAAMDAGDAGGVDMESDALKAAAEGLMQMETNLHITNIRIERAVCTTPETADDALPEHLRVIPWGKLGTRAGAPNDVPIPLEAVLKVSFAAKTGRAGHNSYRGALWSGDVIISQGGYQIRSGVDANLRDAVVQGVVTAGVRDELRVVSIKAGVLTSRLVASIALDGVSTRQRTQKKRGKTPGTVKGQIVAATKAASILFDAEAFLKYEFTRGALTPPALVLLKIINGLRTGTPLIPNIIP